MAGKKEMKMKANKAFHPYAPQAARGRPLTFGEEYE